MLSYLWHLPQEEATFLPSAEHCVHNCRTGGGEEALYASPPGTNFHPSSLNPILQFPSTTPLSMVSGCPSILEMVCQLHRISEVVLSISSASSECMQLAYLLSQLLYSAPLSDTVCEGWGQCHPQTCGEWWVTPQTWLLPPPSWALAEQRLLKCQGWLHLAWIQLASEIVAHYHHHCAHGHLFSPLH